MPEWHIMTRGQLDRNRGSVSTGMGGQHEPESPFTFFGSLLNFKITERIIRLRVTREEENIGSDISQHAETLSVIPSNN
jgi:hypothetical protein